MAVETIITITHENEAAADITGLIQPDVNSIKKALRAIANFFLAIAVGARNAKVNVQVGTASGLQAGGTQAAGTVTFSSLVADDTVTLGATTFTAKVSPSGSTQFALGASDTEAGANLATKINAHATASLDWVATAAAGVVTCKALKVGTYGNSFYLASSNNTRAAVVLPVGGVAATNYVYNSGVA